MNAIDNALTFEMRDRRNDVSGTYTSQEEARVQQ